MVPPEMEQDEAVDDGEVAAEGGEERDDVVPRVSYDVTSYGSDPEIEGLVARMRRGDIIIPPFQRDYVWRQPEASKFIESLLLGLPVPGIFFAIEPDSNKQLVIDGQQRLKTLLYFYDGFFNPREGDENQRVFSLTKVQERFAGKTYKTLEEHDRIRLDTSIMHATTVKQTAPLGDDTSLYHIFERLNSGGRRLTDQEMRLALYHGKLINCIKALNKEDIWRAVFGNPHSRLKDQELILRFFALFDDRERYERPFGEFLNKYAGRNRDPDEEELSAKSGLFLSSLSVFVDALGEKPFRLKKSLNAAIFDSCMVGIATRLTSDDSAVDPTAVKEAYEKLVKDDGYLEAVSRSTADEAFVNRRVAKAIDAFKAV